MSDAQAWTRLSSLIADDEQVGRQVRLAAEDPEAYLAEHEDELAQRGIEEADELQGITALIDALLASGEVAYLDWKEDPAEVIAQLADLPRVRAAGVDLEELDVDGDVERVAAAANAALAPAGIVIVMLDEDSDAFPLVAVPSDRLEAVVEAAEGVDVEVRTF